MRAVWEGPCNYIFCAVRTKMKFQAWQTSGRGAGSAGGPSPGSGGRGCGSEQRSGSLPAAPSFPRPSSWPGRAPGRAHGSAAEIGDPPGPHWLGTRTPPSCPLLGTAGKEPEQSPGCYSLQYSLSHTRQGR